jgi:hypothetical protein
MMELSLFFFSTEWSLSNCEIGLYLAAYQFYESHYTGSDSDKKIFQVDTGFLSKFFFPNMRALIHSFMLTHSQLCIESQA